MNAKQEAEKLLNGEYINPLVAYENVIENLLKELEAKDNIINDLKKQNSKGEINEAYAEKIEADKELISLLKQKVNKLEQKTERLKATERKLAEIEECLGLAHDIGISQHNELIDKQATLDEADKVVEVAKILLDERLRDNMTLRQNLEMDGKYRAIYHKCLSDYEASKEK